MKIRHVVVGLLALVPLLVLALVVGGVLLLSQGGIEPYRVPSAEKQTLVASPEQLAQGEYIARLGNCVTCHSTRGELPLTGGRPFRSEYGTLYSTNLTPDPRTGLGDWSLQEFRHSMRHGVSRHGVLYPAFPYAHFALMTDADLDALYAWLQSLPAHEREPTPNRMEFPASWRTALVGWRMLHYRPAPLVVGANQSPEWQRGRYLVDGLGHCAMCHGTRGPMGSLPAEGYLAGGRIPGIGWYAPPLDAAQLQRYSTKELADYLRSGTSAHGSAYGAMAEVIYNSLRHLREEDALAMATFLKSVPAHVAKRQSNAAPPRAPLVAGNGASLYAKHCADCHGDDGRGESGRYPPLVDAVSVRASEPINVVRLILYGGIPVTTEQNPRPYSMPPFVHKLNSTEVAELANYIRSTWGGRSSHLTADDVNALHGIALD